VELEGAVTQISLSAHTGAGMALLRDHLKASAGYRDAESGAFSARRRHVDALNRARVLVESAAAVLRDTRAQELFAEDLRLAQRALAKSPGNSPATTCWGNLRELLHRKIARRPETSSDFRWHRMKCLVSRRFAPLSSIAIQGKPVTVPPWVPHGAPIDAPMEGVRTCSWARGVFSWGHRAFFMGARMALTDTKLQRLQAKERAYQLADGGGLYVRCSRPARRSGGCSTGWAAGVRRRSG